MQGGRLVRLSCVHVDSLRQQRPHSVQILGLGRLDQRRHSFLSVEWTRPVGQCRSSDDVDDHALNRAPVGAGRHRVLDEQKLAEPSGFLLSPVSCLLSPSGLDLQPPRAVMQRVHAHPELFEHGEVQIGQGSASFDR